MIQRSAAAAVAAAVVIILQGCAPPPEQMLIADFFAASRLRDLTALARIGTVVFEPLDRGIVTTFTVRTVSAETGGEEARQKDVVIEAPVRTPDGRIEEQTLVIRLQRRDRSDESGSPALYRGWIVTGVTQAPSAAVPPPS
jgi:hypothetical protein